MSTAMWWMLIGIVLIVIELMVTSVIAVFFGMAAIVTALLLQFGLIESLAAQYLVFTIVSVATLFFVRGRLSVGSKVTAKTEAKRNQVFRMILANGQLS